MTDRHAALLEAVRVRPNRHAIGLLMGTLEMLDDIASIDDTGETRIEADALRGLIDMNAKIGAALAFDDEQAAAVRRRG